MKTKKLNLNELKVNSFVTSLESKDAQTVKGGGTVGAFVLGAAVVSAAALIYHLGVNAGKVEQFAEDRKNMVPAE